MAQRLTTSAPINWRRTLTIALYGLVWSGPSNHFWQHTLERIFPPSKSDGLRRWAARGEGGGGAGRKPNAACLRPARLTPAVLRRSLFLRAA